MGQDISYLQTSRSYHLFWTEALHNISIVFYISMKSVSLIKRCLPEIYDKAHRGHHLPDALPIHDGLKQWDDLSILLFISAFKHAVRKTYENLAGLNLNQTHQLVVHANNVNLFGENINTINRNTKAVSDSGIEAV
jgi:hypothetical protein